MNSGFSIDRDTKMAVSLSPSTDITSFCVCKPPILPIAGKGPCFYLSSFSSTGIAKWDRRETTCCANCQFLL